MLLRTLVVLVLLGALLELQRRARHGRRVRRREQRYRELLAACIDRQSAHEREHEQMHGGHFTSALRVANVARRFERKIHEAGLPPLAQEERFRRAKEALWPRG